MVCAKRRQLLQAGVAMLAGMSPLARAQQRPPIADMHSHYGMISRILANSGLAEDMRSNGVVLVAWKVVADGRWIRTTSAGIEQSSQPAPGEVAWYFDRNVAQMNAYIA